MASKTQEEREKEKRLNVSTGQAPKGYHNFSWNPTSQKQALIINTQVSSELNGKPCTVFDLIALEGSVGLDRIQGLTKIFGAKNLDGPSRDQAEYLYDKYAPDDDPFKATSNPSSGVRTGAWADVPGIRQNIAANFFSKVVLQDAIMDFVGASNVRYQNISSFGMQDNPFVSIHTAGTVVERQDALRFPYTRAKGTFSSRAHSTTVAPGDKYQSVMSHPFQMVARVGQTIDANNYENLASFVPSGPGVPTQIVITEDMLPFKGKYFRMTLEDFLVETGIDIRALLASGTGTEADAKKADGLAGLPRSNARYVMLGYGGLTAKDILSYNYFVINKDQAKKDFRAPAEMRELEREYAATTDKDKKEKLKEKMLALRKKENRDPCSTLDTANMSLDLSMKDLVMSEKCILASNILNLAQLKQKRDRRIEAYKRVEMAHGSPPEFINKLFMQKGWSNFIQKSTNIQLSHLVPVYRFYKVFYNAQGCPHDEQEMTFPQQTNFSSMTNDNAMKGQVGIKNITWEYISDNPATIRNDVRASVTLFFQNFDELTTPRKGAGSRKWSYLDFLRRPARDMQDLQAKVAAAQAGRKKTAAAKCAKGAPTKGTIGAAGRQPVLNDRDGITHFEMKMVVGWAPAKGAIFDSDMKDGVKHNITPLFLTMIDHEFDIGQDGVFTLTLHYRARIEGLLSDSKANVLATPFVRARRSEVNNELAEAKVYCDQAAVKTAETKLDNINQWARAWMADSLLAELAEGVYDMDGNSQIYTGRVTRELIKQAQWQQTKVKLDSKNTTITNPGALGIQGAKSSWQAFTENRAVMVGQSLDLAGQKFARGKGINLKTDTDDADYRQYVKNVAGQDAQQVQDHQEAVKERRAIVEEEAKGTWTNWFGSFTDPVLAGQIRDEAATQLLITDGSVTKGGDTLTVDEFLDLDSKGGINDPAKKDSDHWDINFVFASDLFEELAKHALDYTDVNVGETSVAYAPCVSKNVKLLLGPLTLKDPFGPGYKTINMGDIPISLRAIRKWFVRNVTDSNRTSLGLLPCLRSLLQESLVDIFNAECFQGTMRQKITFKTGMVSMPSVGDKSPIEARGTTYGDFSTDPAIKKSTYKNNMDLKHITPTAPLYTVDPWKKTTSMFHYIYLYAETSNPEKGWAGKHDADFKRGIYHLYMGAENGLVKAIKFAKTDQPFLREARFEQDSYNPLAELATVYKANVNMVGNTMFHPGQYVYLNMQPLGKDLGHPSTPGTHANQLGLGGYHLITKVKNEISGDNVFSTDLECLFDNSGDGSSRLSSGLNASTEECPEESETDLSAPKTAAGGVGSP